MTKDEALKKIATVNAMDFEYRAWARQALANEALEKKAENARELGLDYEPVIDKSAAVRIATALGWTPQRTWVGLTDEEILDNCESVPDYDIGNHDLIKFARAIEAKLKERNT